MCQIKWVDERLWQWGAWANMNGRDRLGLHGTMLGRMIKQRAGRRVGPEDVSCARNIDLCANDDDAMQVERALAEIRRAYRAPGGDDLVLAVRLKYEFRLSNGRAAARLGVSPSTLGRWIEVAHGGLAARLGVCGI